MEPAITPTSKSPISGWDLLALAGLAALAGLTILLWPRLPDPLPTHWDFHNRPNGWTPKAAVPWIMFGLPLAVWITLALVGRFTRPKDPALVPVLREGMAPLRGFLILAMAVLLSMTVLMPVLGPAVFLPTMLGFLALLAAGIALMARVVRRRLPAAYLAHYKGGLFYVNPDDPRLWVPKLLGVGWTLNYAHRGAWWLTLLLLGLPLAVVGMVILAGAAR